MTNFGRETSCTTELRPGRFVIGVRLVAEAAFRRLTTPRGMLRGGDEEADYGIDLADMIGSVANASDRAALGGRISSELTKDERIISADVTVKDVSEGPGVSWEIEIEAQTTAGPFTLQVGIDGVTVELLGIREG